MAGYMNFEVPNEVQQKALEVLNIAKTTGKIKKGANETTKAIEKGVAKFVLIAGDITPPEIVMHLGPLCAEKGVSYIFVSEKKQLGEVIGIKVGCSSAVIIEAGEAKNTLNDLKEKLKQIKK